MPSASRDPLPAVLFDALLLDAALCPPRATSLADALSEHDRAVASAEGAWVGPLLVPSSQAAALRAAADPDAVLPMALVADQGLLGLQEARHAVQDDAWLHLTHVEIALPAGFAPAEATRALLDELAFTVPTFVQVPRTGFDGALDVLAEDGVEHATYRCGGAIDPADTGTVPADGEIAAFIHGCVSRGLTFALSGGLDHAVRGTDAATGAARHGLLNALAAVAAARSGAGTTELAELMGTAQVETLLATVAAVAPRVLRESLYGIACSNVAEPLADLRALGLC